MANELKIPQKCQTLYIYIYCYECPSVGNNKGGLRNKKKRRKI